MAEEWLAALNRITSKRS